MAMRRCVLGISMVALVLGGWAGWAQSDETIPDSTVAAPDNTERNSRDRSGETVTPFDQKENATDLKLTQTIRKAVVADDSLSTSAKNIKIITANGTVTLRGPVKSQKEKDRIGEKAQRVAGHAKIDNQLEIAPN